MTAPARPTLGHRLNRLGRPGRAVHSLYYALPLVHRASRVLLVLGHMRCGSTLLAHLLAAHPEIAGYGETHLTHRSALDRLRLRLHIFVRQPQARITQRYVMDKVVNEIFEVRPAVLRSPRVRAVLLVREPVAALESLHRVLPDWTEDAVLGHYLTRTRQLEAFAATQAGTGRALVLTHGELVGDTDRVLAALTRWLGLGTSLRDAYTQTPTTGHWGWGDTTDRIWAGHVLREAPVSGLAPPQWLSEPARERAATAYAACLHRLRRDALSLADVGQEGRQTMHCPASNLPTASV